VPDQRRELVRQAYDEIAGSYLAARPTDGADVALLPELLAHLAPNDTVLDAGCGAGVPVMRRVVDVGLRVVGLDFSSRQLSLARIRVPDSELVRGDLAALPVDRECVDAIVSFYAVIHVPREDHPAVLREFHRVLRPGGLALLCLGAKDIPEDRDTESWLGTAMYWSHYDAPTNLELLRDAHFEVIADRVVADPMGHGGHLFVLAVRR
jgi:ubiquinone/menaquinone biosynthesis C-methylase UbiE